MIPHRIAERTDTRTDTRLCAVKLILASSPLISAALMGYAGRKTYTKTCRGEMGGAVGVLQISGSAFGLPIACA